MTLLRPHSLLATAFFFFIVSGYYLMAIKFPIAYIWATYEDLYGEWVQFFFFGAAFLFSIRIVLLSTRYRLFFMALCLACFYVMMEEISWGQRIFNFESPEYFKAHNLQGETNLHNFLTGPFSTTLKGRIEYALAFGFVVYGLIYPLLIKIKWKVALGLDRYGFAAPPLYLWPYFVCAAYLELGPFRFNEAEIAEILIGFSLTVFTLHYALTLPRQLDTHLVATWPTTTSRHLALSISVTTLIVLVFAITTTQSIYASPEGKARADNRVAKGIEKFAKRYTRIEHWDTAIALYENIHSAKPESRSTLRHLALNYRHIGNNEKFETYMNQVLELDLQRYQKDPTRASVNRSLVRSYRILDDQANADKHIQEALKIGLQRIEVHPDSANAAYSLGKTYQLIGSDAVALVQFKRAYDLKPTTKKFKKAYFRARIRNGHVITSQSSAQI